MGVMAQRHTGSRVERLEREVERLERQVDPPPTLHCPAHGTHKAQRASSAVCSDPMLSAEVPGSHHFCTCLCLWLRPPPAPPPPLPPPSGRVPGPGLEAMAVKQTQRWQTHRTCKQQYRRSDAPAHQLSEGLAYLIVAVIWSTPVHDDAPVRCTYLFALHLPIHQHGTNAHVSTAVQASMSNVRALCPPGVALAGSHWLWCIWKCRRRQEVASNPASPQRPACEQEAGQADGKPRGGLVVIG